MVILSLLDEDGEEGLGYDVRTDSQKGRGVFATKEYAPGDVIFTELPSICVPRDRDHTCFHCALPIESINRCASRLTKQKMRIFEVIPMDKKPKVIQDASTELNFCCIECYQSAQQHYLQVYRSKWTEFKAIENWILLNKGPPHDQATLIALVKMLCMRAQGSDLFDDLDAMVDSRNITNLEKFTKVVYSKLKGQNVFLETSEAELLRWAGLCAANFQLGTVSAIKPWLNRIKEIKCLTKLHHAECLKQFKEFDYKAKNVYEKYVQKTKIQINQSSAPHLAIEFRALYNQHSKINHSCAPNVIIKHVENSSKIAIIASKSIAIDDEICFDYTLGKANVSKMGEGEERRRILKQQLDFDCVCPLCVFSMQSMQFKSSTTSENWGDLD